MADNIRLVDPKAQDVVPDNPPQAAEAPADQPNVKNKTVDDFKPKPVVVKLGDQEFTLLYDLNAFCEMETMYESVDSVIQMLMGAPAPDLSKVTYNDAPVNAGEIAINGKPLAEYIQQLNNRTKAKYADTLNLLWLGVLHDHTEYDADGEVLKYTINKHTLGKLVTLQNLREVNAKIMTAILRDLLPALVNAGKNEEAQEAEAE